MDFTRVGLGLVLLGLGTLALVGTTPSDGGIVGTAFAVAGAVVAAGALLIGLARDHASGRVRFRP